MPRTTVTVLWERVAARQAGLVTRRQLNRFGHDRHYVRGQLRARRWQEVSATVLATTTGRLTREQLAWAGTLHAGPGSAVGGLTAAEMHGLAGWQRPAVTVHIGESVNVEPIPGVQFVKTRRDIVGFRSTHWALPTWQVEPAVLLFAGYTRSSRTAVGVLAASVQQGLTTPDRLLGWVARMRPLRRAAVFREALWDMGAGAQSVAEIDVGRVCRRFGLPPPRRQVRRTDRSGRRRYTDCEWDLPDGRVVVLEVDGAFHMEAEHWAADMARERELVIGGRIVIRCTARELRDDPEQIVRDLIALGVTRLYA
jgi:hypothetical protein